MSDEGQIGEIDLIQRLVDLGRERFTGAIRFEQDGIIKIVYFKDGDVLSASTNDRTDAVDEILLRAGKVSKDHVKQALSKRKEHESLGDALLNLGFITRKELAWGRRIQVIGILRSVRGWDHGQYAIVADYLPKREEGTLFPLQQILIELYVTEQERQPFERALNGGQAVLAKNDGFDAAFQKLGLNDEAAEIASKIDGNRSAADIVAATGKDAFNTYKLLEALRVLGLLRKIEKPQAEDELGFASIGVFDAEESMTRRPTTGRTPIPEFQTEPEPPVEPTGEEAPPPPIAVVTPPNPPDVQWGFDEAQIEAVTNAAAPPPPPARTRGTATQTQTRRTPPQFTRPQPKKSRQAPVFVLVFLLIIVGAAFGGWYWWKSQPVPAATPVATKPKPAPVQPQPVVTAEVGGKETPVEKTPQPQPMPPPVSAPVAAPVPQSQPAPVQTSAAKFTLQIELVCQQASLAKAQQIGGSNVWSAPITYRNQACHRVFWGRYATRDEADAAASQIPAELRASKPVVVTIPQ
ncbi:MAG TPA: DUF4388 domain-containing protein [Thermoanaerobaculia bacterium]|nr:DUF4388 domain-containing protein [Thermoanaerobaculia bacterium]